MRIAWIGTGLMGRPMAERLLGAGHEVTVYNRTREKAEALSASGASVAGSAQEAIAGGEAVFLMLKDAGAIRDLLFDGDLGGRTVVQMSTIGPSESVALAEEVRQGGGDYLEAPVLGSTPQAKEGKLLVMVGGTPEQFGRWSEVLRAIGPEPIHVGPVGQAAALKLALNQLIAALSATFSLSLGMVRRQGIDVNLFMDILRKSTFHAPTFDRKLPGMLARDFSDPNFPAALMLKDLGLIHDNAADLGLDTTVLDGVRDVVRRAVERGLGGADYSALYEVVDPE
ncbi:MAG TPA: NAD(P)-dependent oxidoreductase [Thermoanaerobaculia bacterium]|nr:NAD(P)-dependent oxidoreductase [Thermoanaerobaculia bacterium]